jgi:hypothetical protein
MMVVNIQSLKTLHTLAASGGGIRTMLYSYHVSYIVPVEGVMHQAFATVLVEPNFLLREGQFS